MAALLGNGSHAAPFGAGCCEWHVLRLSLVCHTLLHHYSFICRSVVLGSNVFHFAALEMHTAFGGEQ
jgi:hypothetical protein